MSGTMSMAATYTKGATKIITTEKIISGKIIPGITTTLPTQRLNSVQTLNGTQNTQNINGTQRTTSTQELNGTRGLNGVTQGLNGTQELNGTQKHNGTHTQALNGTQSTQNINGTQRTTSTQEINGTRELNGTSGVNGSHEINGTQKVSLGEYNALLLKKVNQRDLPGAWQVWRRMRAHNVEADSETFRVLKIEKGMGFGVLLAEAMAKKPPDLTTFILRAKNLSKNGDVEEGKRLLDTMKASGVTPNVFIYNKLLGIFGKHGELSQFCFKLFDDMKAARVMPDVFTYNTLMDIKGKLQDENGCLALFEEMKVNEVDPDVISYNVLLRLKGKKGDEVGCANLLNTMLATRVIPDLVSFNIMLSLFAKKNDIESCRQVLDQVKLQFGPDIASYNIILESFAKNKDIEGCRQIIQEMRQDKIEPNVLTLNIITGNFSTPNILHGMLCNIPKCLDTYNIEINSAISELDIKTVIRICKEMRTKNISPDSVTYSTVLKAFIKAKDSDADDVAELRALLKAIRSSGVLMNIQAYHMLVSEAAEKGNVDDCQRILSEMKDAGLTLDTQLYTTLMDKLAKQGHWKEAQQLFSDMKAAGVSLDAHVYSVVLMYTARNSTLDDCLNICREMKQNNILPNAHTYSILMTACVKQRQSVELCFQVLEAMRANHIQPVPQTYMPLIPLIFKYGLFSHLHTLYKDIKSSGTGDKAQNEEKRGFTAASIKQLLGDLHSHMQALNFNPPPIPFTLPTKNNVSSRPSIKDMLDCL